MNFTLILVESKPLANETACRIKQVGLEPTRPKALVSKTSAAAITPPGQNILENDK